MNWWVVSVRESLSRPQREGPGPLAAEGQRGKGAMSVGLEGEMRQMEG